MARVTYIGHATALIEADGVKVLTDPMLRTRVGHLRRIASLGPVPQLGPDDVVLISHAHHDHLDIPSLRLLASASTIVVPPGSAKLVRRAGFKDVRELEPGDQFAVGEIEITATPAHHEGRRWLLVGPDEAVGYVIHCGRRIYFAGDTDLFAGMGDLREDLDLALLPVAGWGPRLPAGHLDPERAARAAHLLRPRIAVPIHWGTYTSPGARPANPEASAREFAAEAAARAPGVEVRILSPGESLTLD
jgi:L-ascorbate metabolism protein UlaG (beta-lactamase superfamily)